MAKKVPDYLLHKPTGLARVLIDRGTHYLGRFGSPEPKVRYDKTDCRVASLQRRRGAQGSFNRQM